MHRKDWPPVLASRDEVVRDIIQVVARVVVADVVGRSGDADVGEVERQVLTYLATLDHKLHQDEGIPLAFRLAILGKGLSKGLDGICDAMMAVMKLPGQAEKAKQKAGRKGEVDLAVFRRAP